MRLTLRTLLAYLDDTLPPDQARLIGQKVAESDTARELVEKIKKVTRRRGLSTPTAAEADGKGDPNTVAEYLSDVLPDEQVAPFEKTCLESDVHLAEVGACHQLLTLLMTEPVRVPPTARQRMYGLVKGRESLPSRKPGKTVPVAGEMPADESPATASDADAAYLLGLPAFSQSGPASRRGLSLAVAGGLLAAFAFAVWMAVPVRQREVVVAKEPEAVLIPMPPMEPPPAKPPEPPPVKPAEPPLNPMAPAVAPVFVDPPAAAPPVVPPAPPADPVQPPRPDRGPVGKLETPDRVVVNGMAGTRWVRATADKPDIGSTDQTVCLPGHKAKVRLVTGVVVEMWGNLPDQVPIPVYESAVVFHQPTDGFDADFELLAGRVYLTATKPGAKVRLRVRDRVWDVVLKDQTADVVAEVVNVLARGLRQDADPAELRQLSLGLACVRGAATVRANAGPELALKEKHGLSWSSDTGRIDGPTPLANTPPFKDSAYYSKFPPSAGTDAKSANQAVSDLSRRAGTSVDVPTALLEAVREEKENEPLSLVRVAGARAGVFGLAALGDTQTLIDLIADPRPFVRDAAAYAMATGFAARPERFQAFRDRIKDKYGMDDAQTATCVRYLRGGTDEERKDAALLDQLVDALSAPSPVTRELAFWALKADIDPTARTNQLLIGYNSAASPAGREAAVKAWKRRIDELKR